MKSTTKKIIIKLLYFSTLAIQLSCAQVTIGDVKPVPIVAFQPQTTLRTTFETVDIHDYLRTTAFTVCFRYMTRFITDFVTFLDTNQMSFGVYKNFAYVILRSWNASSTKDEYHRKLHFCNFYKPGRWVSVCLQVKLESKNQDITFFQDGELCFKRKFTDRGFEWLFFEENASIEDILR